VAFCKHIHLNTLCVVAPLSDLSLIAQDGVAAAAAAKNDSKMLTTGPNFLGGRLRYDDYD
jgi:hypothetical protein